MDAETTQTQGEVPKEETENVQGTGGAGKTRVGEAKEDLRKVVNRLEKANKERAEILDREEELAAKDLLGGTTKIQEKEKPKEESPEDYAKRVLTGNV